MVLVALESDAACTSLNGHSAWKSALLVLEWCCKAKCDREQDFWRYWLPESCIKQCYDKPTGDGCLCKKCRLGEEWKIEIPVSHTLSTFTDVEYANTSFRYWFTPLTRLSIHTADNFLLPLLFLMSVSISSGCPIINIFSCLQDMKLSWIGLMAFHPYTWFHYFLTICLMIVATLAIFQVWVGVGSLPWMIWYR